MRVMIFYALINRALIHFSESVLMNFILLFILCWLVNLSHTIHA